MFQIRRRKQSLNAFVSFLLDQGAKIWLSGGGDGCYSVEIRCCALSYHYFCTAVELAGVFFFFDKPELYEFGNTNLFILHTCMAQQRNVQTEAATRVQEAKRKKKKKNS